MECPLPAAAIHPFSLCSAVRPLALLLGLLLLPAPALAMELEGKTVYTWSVAVKNEYAGSVLEVLKKEGEEVAKDEVVARYRLAPRELESIRAALDDKALRDKDARIQEWNARIQLQTRQVEQLRSSVQAGYEAPLRLESEEAALDLYQTQLREAQRAKADLTARLESEQERISEDLGGLKVTRRKVPDAIPLNAPYEGVISKMTLQPGQRLAAKAECFKVAAKAISVKVRVYAEDYQKLHTGDEATVTIQGFPDRTFPAVLFNLPLKPVDKGFMDLSYYEILFRVTELDTVVREGLSARVTVP